MSGLELHGEPSGMGHTKPLTRAEMSVMKQLPPTKEQWLASLPGHFANDLHIPIRNLSLLQILKCPC